MRKYSINSFWQDVIDVQDVLDLTDERAFIKKPAAKGAQRVGKRRLEKEKEEKEKERLKLQDAAGIEDGSCPMEIDNVS